jgi:hypothetical protein
LLRNPPAQVAAAWTVNRRHGSTPVGAVTLRNAATMKDETAADALALAGDRAGRASGFSAFTLVPDATNPSVVMLAIDLPGQPATLIGFGIAHPFVAGGGSVVPFTRVPFSAQYPDRYALQASGGMYLSVGTDGYAVLAPTQTWFEFRPTPDGHTELDYGAGVLYVDGQYRQYHWGESPDDIWANGPNVAITVPQWSAPNDGIPRTQPTGSLLIYPPCIDGAGNTSVPTVSIGGVNLYTTGCDSALVNLSYVSFGATLVNQDSFARAFRLSLQSRSLWLPLGSGSAAAGLHCYGGNQSFDTTNTTVTPPATSADSSVAVYTVTVPANGSLPIWCQHLGISGLVGSGQVAALQITGFVVQPCKGAAGGSCVVYP